MSKEHLHTEMKRFLGRSAFIFLLRTFNWFAREMGETGRGLSNCRHWPKVVNLIEENAEREVRLTKK